MTGQAGQKNDLFGAGDGKNMTGQTNILQTFEN